MNPGRYVRISKSAIERAQKQLAQGHRREIAQLAREIEDQETKQHEKRLEQFRHDFFDYVKLGDIEESVQVNLFNVCLDRHGLYNLNKVYENLLEYAIAIHAFKQNNTMLEQCCQYLKELENG
jgi:hypothetical protein